MASNNATAGPETLVTVKVGVGDECRRFKLALKELGPNQLPAKLRALLNVPPSMTLLLERYSDSAASYVTLSSDNTAVYKQLYRAAKAKLKLKIRATVLDLNEALAEPAQKDAPAVPSKEPLPTQSSEDKAAPSAPLAIAPQLHQVGEPQALLKKKMPLGMGVPTSRTIAKDPTLLPVATFTVCCNICNADIPGAHWHCGICEAGDYDLCSNCVDLGHHCDVDSHFLIKRMIENGRVINSSVQRIPKKIRPLKSADTLVAPAPTAVEPVKEVSAAAPKEPSRTCNSCINTYDGSNFVTCNDCEDYDLCFSCHLNQKHGHHPGHSFSLVDKNAVISAATLNLCEPGRHVRHLAICDGCDKEIRGVRHKCLACPDWDYCSTCMKSAAQNHANHRFVPIYEAIPLPNYRQPIHYGVRCDGPLCADKARLSCITGVRYKCAVCHDLDFCANCEALPSNPHNRTHPLIKMRMSVQNLSVTTHDEAADGKVFTLGDRQPRTESKSTETVTSANANASTQVQTIAEFKPAERIKEAAQIESQRGSPVPQYEALFERDVIPDGTKMSPSNVFEQVWTIRNPGPLAWPSGCCLRFVGGDRMLCFDSENPASTSDIDKAVTSNIIDRSVGVGEKVDFTVTLKAPERPGKAISYWRVKTPEGMAFGHKLWCEIDVLAETSKPSTPTQPTSSLDSHVFAAELQTKSEEITRLSQVVSSLQDEIVKAQNEKAAAIEDANSAMQTERASLLERLEKAHAEATRIRESQMIFPKLDKESPQSSVYENASQTQVEPTALEDEELVDDVESVDAVDDDSTDEGFLTDEEYEILDSEFEEMSQAHA